MSKSEMRVSPRNLVDQHFDRLRERDIFVSKDGLSRVYNPCRMTGTPLDFVITPIWILLAQLGRGRFRHINYFTFGRFFQEIARLHARLRILETGSSAYGVSSSRLLGSLADATDGTFDTVDLDPQTHARVSLELKALFPNRLALRAHCGDSIAFLHSIEGSANVIYLDSYNLDPDHFDEAAAHGLAEFEALLPHLDAEGAVILIDDTPGDRAFIATQLSPAELARVDKFAALRGYLPGKGATIAKRIDQDGRFRIVAWEYQLLITYRA